MPTPDEIIGSGANIVNPDQAAMDLLSQRQAGSDLMSNLSNMISMAGGDAVTPAQIMPAAMPLGTSSLSPGLSASDLMAQQAQQSQADSDTLAARQAPLNPNLSADGRAAASRAKKRTNQAAAMDEANSRSVEWGDITSKFAAPPLAPREAFDADTYNQNRVKKDYISDNVQSSAPSVTEAVDGGASSDFESFSSDFQPRNMAPDSAVISPLAPAARARFASHQEAMERHAEIRDIRADYYTSRGQSDVVDTPAFKREVQGYRAEEGLAENPDAQDARLQGEASQERSSLRMGQFKTAVGFGALATGQAAGQAYASQNRGEYLTESQRNESNAGMLPGAMSMMGAVAGLGFGSPIAGALIAGGIGSIAQGVIGAASASGDAVDRGSQSLGEGRGGADAIKEFAEALRNSGTPAVKDLADTMSRLGQSGAVSAGAAKQFAQFQTPMGAAFGDNVATEGRFLESNGFLAPVRATFGTAPLTGLTAGDYAGNAAAAAMSGDYAGMKASLAFEEAKAGKDTQNPAYNRDKGVVDRYEAKSWFEKQLQIAQDDRTGDFGQTGAYNDAKAQLKTEPEYLSRQDKDKAAKFADEARDIDNMFVTHKINMANVDYGVSETGRDTTKLSNLLLGGAGAAAIGAAIPGVSKDVALGTASLDLDIAQNKQNAEKYPLQKAFFLAQAADDEQKEEQLRSTVPSMKRAYFGTRMGEEQSNFSLFEAKDTLSGMSAKDMQAGYDRQAEYLSGLASNPGPLSPTERAGIEQSSLQMRYNSAQNLYGEENRSLDITRAQRQGDLSRADILGTPQDAYDAGIKSIQSDRDQLNQNNSELQRGNLTFAQRQQITRQNIDIQTDIDTGPEKARVKAYDSEISILGDNQAANRAGLSRAVSIGGADAITSQTFTDDQANIGIAKAARDGSPAGSAQYAKFNRQYQDSLVQQQEDFTSSMTFRETAAERTSGSILSGEQFRANRIGGVGAQDAAAAQVGRDASLLSELNGKRYDTTDPLAKEANTRARQGYENDMAEQVTRSQTYSETVQDRTRDSNINSAFRRAMKNPYQDGDSESNPFTRGEASLSNLRGELTQAQSALSKSTDPNAILANTERVNSFKDQITDIEAMRRTAMMGALPEFIGGAGGRGVMSGVMPTEGQSSFYNSNPYITGSFGKPNIAGDSGGHIQAPGGAAGNFLAAAGHAASGGADANTAILSQIRDLLQRGSTPGGRSPAMPSPSGFSQNNNLYANTQRSYIDLH